MTLTITDLFCGAGGSSSGAELVPGVRVRMAANHWRLAVETHNRNLPHADHDVADISQADPRRYPRTDILWASPECFTAGHLVTAARGQVPIEAVQVGDMVLTHKLRWRRVVRVQSRTADTVVVKGQGHTGIEVTSNHQFWLRRSQQTRDNEIRQYRRQYDDAGWLAIVEAPRAQACWATPTSFEEQPTHTPPAGFGLDLSAAWWLVGRWVGDGSLTFGRNHEVVITCSFAEADELADRLKYTGATWARRRMRTAEAFTLGDRKARDWLLEHFGHGAAVKALPIWSLSLPHFLRRALVDGYLSAHDGGVTQRRVRVSTVSRALAVSMRMLAESLGHRVAMAHDNRTTYQIEGRAGVARVQWILHWEPSLAAARSPEAFVNDGMAWSRVRRVGPGRTNVTVYNIEVEEDHSYVLDGIVVANCTNHSQARGQRRVDQQPSLFDEILPSEAAERSRATMFDALRFAEVHRYRAIVVENVVDVRDWVLWPAWILGLENLGYDHAVVYLNSMFAQGAGAPAPQSRDRLYVVAWRRGHRRPDLDRWTQPAAWCPQCDTAVRAVQAWKRPDRPRGRYRHQYVYRCPTPRCHLEVYPGVLPAAVAIDWTLAGERIGDRARPLAPKTIARIEAGLRRYARPIHLEAAGNTFERPGYLRAWPVDEPFKTMHTTASKAVACPPFIALLRTNAMTHGVDEPLNTISAGGGHHGLVDPLVVPLRTHGVAASAAEPFKTVVAGNVGMAVVDPILVPAGGTWNERARPVSEPFRTRTTRDTEALVVPVEGRDGIAARPVDEPARTQTARLQDALVVPLRNHGVARPADAAPAPTVAAAGNHHALVMRNNTARGDQGQMSTPVDEPLRTLTTTGNQSLIRWDHLLVPYYGSRATARRVDEPAGTVTTVDRHALVGPDIAVDDCTFRMLEPHEIQAAMAFAPAYIVLGNKRERVRQLGNAVTPPAARDLIAAIVEAITGEEVTP